MFHAGSFILHYIRRELIKKKTAHVEKLHSKVVKFCGKSEREVIL